MSSSNNSKSFEWTNGPTQIGQARAITQQFEKQSAQINRPRKNYGTPNA